MGKQNWKIVADSSCDLITLEDIDFDTVPLTITAGDRTFTDDKFLDVSEMREYLAAFKGKSSTACPSIGAWLDAFADAENIICITLTSGLSGTADSANLARNEYLEQHPERKVMVLDSLSTGPEMALLVMKARDLIMQDLPADEVFEKMWQYHLRTGLIFSMETLHNFANNGRVSPVLAKGISAFGIRIIAKASDTGVVEPVKKCKGAKHTIKHLVTLMAEEGFQKGRVSIAQNNNPDGAEKLAKAILERFPEAEIEIHEVRGLCCYYAESGSLLIGFERPEAYAAACANRTSA